MIKNTYSNILKSQVSNYVSQSMFHSSSKGHVFPLSEINSTVVYELTFPYSDIYLQEGAALEDLKSKTK